MAARLFGFSIEDLEKTPPGVVSPVPPNNQDGSENYISSGFFGSYVDIEGVYRTENDLIRRYRQMSLYPECDSAIEDIVNEAIVADTDDTPVAIELSNLNASDNIKKRVREEFKYILELLDFDRKAHEIFRNWYIDGRLYYNKVIDQKAPHEVILILDATTGQNVLNQVEEFNKIIPVTGLIMTKLDSTAKGGILIAVAKKYKLPIIALGLGEKIDDLQIFDAEKFANAFIETN